MNPDNPVKSKQRPHVYMKRTQESGRHTPSLIPIPEEGGNIHIQDSITPLSIGDFSRATICTGQHKHLQTREGITVRKDASGDITVNGADDPAQ